MFHLFMLDLYELTRTSGFINKLHDKPGISIMADRVFTIRDI